MAGNPQGEVTSLGGGSELWDDGSGGALVLGITGPDAYTHVHKVHVLPFGSGGSGVYNAPPAGVETNLGQTADNLMALIAACYNADAFGAVQSANQIDAGGDALVPYTYAFGAGAAFAAGTAAGTRWDTWVTARFTGLDTFGGKFSLELPGVSQSVLSRLFRIGIDSATGALKALGDYLSGQTNGGVHAAKTAIVSHAGNPLRTQMFIVGSTNKRLRRHFKVS